MEGPGSDTPDDGSTESSRQGKVARVLEQYELTGLGDEMAAAWTADGEDRMSLRELATMLNKRLIESALRDAGLDTLPGEIDSVHSVLADEEASEGVRQEVRGRLERAGIDIESLEADLVSYQAVRTYLQADRGLEYTREESDPVESTTRRIQRLQGRLRAVTDQRLDSLEEAGHISMGAHSVLVQVQVFCEDCGRQYSIESLLENGGCDCER